MSSTRQPGQARLLALLATLLGLLAMHGLASTHHAGASSPAGATTHAAAPATEHGQHHHRQAAPLDAASARAALPEPTCHDDCSDALAMLCVAVLAGVAVALLARRHAHRPRRRARHLPLPRAPVAALRWRAAPDPVAELCVSRT